MKQTPSCNAVSTKQRKIATLAQIEPKMALTTLAHHIDVEWLMIDKWLKAGSWKTV